MYIAEVGMIDFTDLHVFTNHQFCNSTAQFKLNKWPARLINCFKFGTGREK